MVSRAAQIYDSVSAFTYGVGDDFTCRGGTSIGTLIYPGASIGFILLL